MEKGKILFFILFFIFLQSCSLIRYQSLYYIDSDLCNIEINNIKNSKYYNNKKNNLDKQKCKHSFIADFEKEKQYILIILPGNINGGLGDGFLESKVFFVSTKKKYPSFKNNNEVFSIQIHGINKKMTDLFKKNIDIKLKVDDKIYEYSKKTFLGYDVFFYFPLKIKNVREGILIIEYKNVIKKVNFKLGFEKYVVPN